ncbi:receptor-type tyrosine-protein phosphatase beta isoform X6 [Trematomus bernacchii]|uniref:receptor-type tyrosine-protein phosphatase beta isoform X6 n=1 Tax=Trematomus bernacchii TaxID=40690 RepID=UPI00146A3AFE|nr:receptor-type tyrosine-protein phosphatase beta isoform X6 [Trematomus bernacchii]
MKPLLRSSSDFLWILFFFCALPKVSTEEWPKVVRNLSVTEITTSSISVMWNEPVGNSSSYRVQWSDGNVTKSHKVNQTQINITDLTAGVQYDINLTAVPDDGSTEGQSTTVSQYTKPGTIGGPTDSTSTSSISLNWTPPPGEVLLYRVEWNHGGAKTIRDTNNTFAVLSDLIPGTSYNILIFAVAGDNQTTGDPYQLTIVTKPEVVRNLSVTEITTSSISVMWNKPEGNSSFYRVHWSDGNIPKSDNVTETNIIISNLTAGVQYDVNVTAVAGDGSTEGQSTTVSQYTRPKVVRNLSVTEITTSSISVMWNKPEGNSSSYRVQWSDGNVNKSDKVTETNITITDLTAGVQYDINVTAVAGDGSTEGQSATVSQYTKPGTIGGPTDSTSTSSISLNWTPPPGEVLLYRVEWDHGGAKTIRDTNNTFAVLSDLIPGTSYNILIFAVAGDNQTTGDPYQLTIVTKPGTIGGPTDSTSTSSISLNWTPPPGEVLLYRVEWNHGGAKTIRDTNNTFAVLSDLIPGTSYNILIFAVAGDNQTTGDPYQLTIVTKPEVVRNLSVTEITTSSISVMWNKPEGNSSFYRVHWSDGDVTKSENLLETNITITDLTAGVQYDINVTAVAGDGSTEGQSATVSQYTKPQVVRNLSVTEITTSSISVMWNKPEVNSSSYRVQWSDGNVTKSDKVNQTNITITDLTAGVQYAINVTAVAGDGSTEGQSATVSQYTKPGTIGGPTDSTSTSSISLNWTPPPGEVLLYRVEWDHGGAKTIRDTNNTFAVLSDLIPGTSYNILIFAVAGDNQTTGDPYQLTIVTKPKVVRNLSVTEITTSSISVMWNKPEGNSSSYRVQWSDGDVTKSHKVNQTQINITDLTAGVQYDINVTAVAGDGSTEGQSTTVSQYTKPGTIGGPTDSTSTSSISLNWTPPPGEVLLYRVEWNHGGAKTIRDTNNTFAVLSDLIPGTSYNILIFAVAGDNQTTGDPYQLTIVTKPEVVRNLSVTEITTSSISVMWNKPEGNSSSYRVQWSDGDVTKSHKVNQTQINITDLTAGVQYDINVTAVAGDGSTEGQSTTVSQYTKPGTIGGPTDSTSTSSISLNWTPPPGEVLLYRVEWNHGGAKTIRDTNNTFAVLSDLIPGTSYNILIFAVAGDNQTTGDPYQLTIVTKPEVVRNLSVTEITTSSISVMWNKPEGNSSFYRVHWSDGDVTKSENLLETNITITDLTAGVQYDINVTAVAGDGSTEGQSATVSQYTKPQVVRNLSVTEITTSSISVMWNKPEGNSSSYRVQWSDGNVTKSDKVTETNITITDLTAGVQYDINVTAVAGDGSTEGQSATVSQYTKPGTIEGPTDSTSTSSISLNWTPPPGEVLLYRVEWDHGGAKTIRDTNNTFAVLSDLIPGTSYNILIFAVAGDNQTTGDPYQLNIVTRPEVVRNLSVTEITTSSISVMWNKPEGNSSSYRVQWSDGDVTKSHKVNQTQINITDLTAGVQYDINVTAVAGDGSTEGQSTTVSQYTKPGTIGGPTDSTSTSSISLNWTPPPGEVLLYRVEWNHGGAKTIRDTNNTFAVLSDLIPGTSYNILIFAVAGDNQTTGDPYQLTIVTKPEVVRNLSVTEITTSSISVMWNKPEGNSSSYRVHWSDGDVTKSENLLETNITITDLTAGVQYDINVTAVAGDGSTEGQSATVSQYTKPEVVRNLSVTEITTSSISVMWNKPEGNSSSYRVHWSDGNVTKSDKVNQTQINITDLTAGVQYDINVTAVAGDGSTEGQSTTVSQYTKPGTIGVPIVSTNTSSISLNWAPPPGEVLLYRVEWDHGGAKTIRDTNNTFAVLSDLIPGTSYNILIFAVAGDNQTTGDPYQLTIVTEPEVVRNLSVTEITTSSISVMWNEPEGNSSSYRVQWSDGNVNKSENVIETNITITDLTAGVQYDINVTAVADDGSTEGQSATVSQYTRPEVVRNLSVTEITTSSISVMWNKPEGNSSSYRVQWSDGNVTKSDKVNQTQINITDLTAGVQYDINVTAVAGDGSTEGQSATVSQYTKPGTIGVPIVSANTSSISLNWTPPPGEVLLYRVEWDHGGAKTIRDTNNTFAVLSDLIPGTSYNISIIAVAGDNQTTGDPYQLNIFTKPAGVENLSIIAVTYSSVSLIWKQPKGNVSSYSIQWNAIGETLTLNNTTIETNFTINNLIPGVQYNILVAAVAGKSSNKGAGTSISTFTRPEKPENIKITARGTSNLTIEWTLPLGRAVHYVVNISNEIYSNSTTTAGKEATFTDLFPGRLYNITVTAVAGNFRKTSEQSSFATEPTPPGSIIISQRTNSSLFLRWDTHVLMDGAPSISYNISYQHDGGEALNKISSDKHTELTSLLSGKSYNINVQTVGPQGLKSTAVQITSFTLPNPVLNLEASPKSTTSVKVSWSPPQEAWSYYEYLVQAYTTTGELVFNITVSNNSADVTSLEPGNRYNINVTTRAAAGSESTVEQTFSYTMPKAVSLLKVEYVNTTAIRLTWHRQSDHKPTYSYLVKALQNTRMVQNSSTNTESFTFYNLKPGELYTFDVFTVVGGVKSTVESISSYTRPETVSGIIALGSTTTMSVSWTLAFGQVDSYTVLLQKGGELERNKTDLSNATVYIEFPDLTPGVLYCVIVVTRRGPFQSNLSDCNATFPNPPGPITVVSQTETSINFTWAFPNMDYNQFTFSVSNFSRSSLVTHNWFLLDKLQSGSPYSIAVVTVGVLNYTSTAVTTENYTRPYSVTNLRETEITTDSVTLEWEQPEDKNYSYVVQTSNGSFNSSETVRNKHNQTIHGLLSGSNYSFTVTTQTADGTEAAPMAVSYFTRPYRIEQLEAVTSNSTAVCLVWTKPPEYKSEYRYRVEYAEFVYESKNKSSKQNDTEISGLIAGTNYTFCVFVMAANGIEGEARCISKCTNASPVKYLRCEGPNTAKAELILKWHKPNGQYSGFKVTYNGYITSTKNCCEHTVTNLPHYTEYNLTMETQSCGLPSTPQNTQCRTGITNPSIPANFTQLVKVGSMLFSTFTLQIDYRLLDNTNGPITHVGVLVTNDLKSDTNWTWHLRNTYSQWKAKKTSVYLATVKEILFQTRSGESHFNIAVGDESDWKGYTNGALDANGKYQYAIVLFTHLNMENNLVLNSKSLVAIAHPYPVVILPQNPAIIGIAVGVTLGIFCILFIILIGFIVYWKRVSNKESSDIQIFSMRAKVSLAVRVEDYEAYYKKQKADSSCGFAEEFEDLKMVGTAQLKSNAERLENKPKNRYANVLPYDSSRVKLSIIHGSPYDDYINANYMPGYNSRKEFIAAQGPLPGTVNDFWRMIWEKNVRSLVMLTRCNEQGRVKCEQYWAQGTKHFENITVTTTSEIALEDWTIRDFDIKNVKTAETRSVRHFHFTAWPDHGVPQTTELLISFRHLVREHMDQFSRHSPTVVHCSAGVGRTGTFIAIDHLMFQIERENIVDVFGIVYDLRMHRPLMVQTEDQYVFLNQCAIDIIRSRTGTNVDLIYQNAAALSIYENVEPKKGFSKSEYNNA